jgi:hypothetical protein
MQELLHYGVKFRGIFEVFGLGFMTARLPNQIQMPDWLIVRKSNQIRAFAILLIPKSLQMIPILPSWNSPLQRIYILFSADPDL